MYGIEQQDVYGGKAPWMADFETEVASTLGKEAAVFCPSGVMAQLIALKIHAGSGGENAQNRSSSVFLKLNFFCSFCSVLFRRFCYSSCLFA